jgi:hypothetical protein
MFRILSIALASLLLQLGIAVAQSAKQIPVAVNYEGKGQIGQQFTFAVKEAIRGSQSFKFVDFEPRRTAKIVVHFASLPATDKEYSSSTVIAEVIVYDDVIVRDDATLPWEFI